MFGKQSNFINKLSLYVSMGNLIKINGILIILALNIFQLLQKMAKEYNRNLNSMSLNYKGKRKYSETIHEMDCIFTVYQVNIQPFKSLHELKQYNKPYTTPIQLNNNILMKKTQNNQNTLFEKPSLRKLSSAITQISTNSIGQIQGQNMDFQESYDLK